ncbi:uncharacterized protein CHSO_3483 [Chryseobacterium sp. StRB126]|uniref:hypothetical protein n=1 Tax=Chryseobacterium sp. StRB126 TaxID=878220 RepID=UPI0004E99140|nr:hypothetical protein [Chryseobacterium sp. StRB126]BAP32520.1 uncharacterized protein CHSO_3483 [Chryseobacterium sp. StRB126]
MDITNLVKKAINLNVNWKHGDFYEMIEILSIRYIVNYEINEEKIAMIQVENEIIGFIFLNYPLFFIENKYLLQLKKELEKYDYIQFINVDSIYHKYLSIDENLYNTYFDYMDNIDIFSAQDFYFYNVT